MILKLNLDRVNEFGLNNDKKFVEKIYNDKRILELFRTNTFYGELSPKFTSILQYPIIALHNSAIQINKIFQDNEDILVDCELIGKLAKFNNKDYEKFISDNFYLHPRIRLGIKNPLEFRLITIDIISKQK